MKITPFSSFHSSPNDVQSHDNTKKDLNLRRREGSSFSVLQRVSVLVQLELCADEQAAALGGLRTGGGGAPRIFYRRRRRGFMVGGGGFGGVRPDERALKQRTRWTGVFFWF